MSTDRPPSLRRRLTTAFAAVFVAGAILFRLMHYLAAVDAVERDVDIQLWSRLGAVKAAERFAPESLADPATQRHVGFLPEAPRGSGWTPPHLLGLGVPRIDPAAFGWFAGVWQTDGTPAAAIGLPNGFSWDPAWRERLDSIWTSPDRRYRLAATAGGHGTVIVAGTPLATLAAGERAAAVFQVWTFVVWVPIVLGAVWLALSRLLEPLDAITATARRIRAGRFGERLDTGRAPAEFGELAATVNDMLDRLDAVRLAQSHFNADVAHQLLNPVHAILLEAEAGGRMPADPAAEPLARVSTLARRIEDICEILLAYSRSAELDPARLRAIDLEPVVVAAIDRTAERARAAGVAIVPPDGAAIVKGDAALLEEVFVNLLVNAIDHAPAGSRVAVAVSSTAPGVEVAVVDHGSGVAAAEIPKLFERFHTGKPGGGHGIGLALSRLIARSHGGDIAHAPTPGGGATFTVRLPRA